MPKKQPWDQTTLRPPKQWPGPDTFNLQKPWDRYRKPEPDVEPEKAETDNNHYDNPLGVFQPVTTPDQLHSWFKTFYDNLRFLEAWKPHELLMLIQQHVDISTVTHDWLIKFREDLDLKV